jgi:phosphatidylcholine synthase
VLPNFDGRRLDDIVDYLGWVLVPILLLVVAGQLPAWAAAAPLLASGYGFAQEQAKTEDNYFLGWPSYWSILAFILFEFDAPQWVTTAFVLFFSVMILVPIRYPYPSRMSGLRLPTLLLTIPWMAIGLYQIYLLPERPLWLAILYCFYPVYYTGLTIYLAWQRRQRAKALPPLDAGRAV